MSCEGELLLSHQHLNVVKSLSSENKAVIASSTPRPLQVLSPRLVHSQSLLKVFSTLAISTSLFPTHFSTRHSLAPAPLNSTEAALAKIIKCCSGF